MTKITRKPRTEEQKEAARQLYHSQHKGRCDEVVLNSNSKLEDFALKFVSWLMIAYDEAERSGNIKPSPYDKVKFTKIGSSIRLELSLTWLREKYGSKSVEAFKRLFIQTQAGGRTRATLEVPSVSYNSQWIKNDEAYPRFRQLMISIFKRNGEVTASDVWGILKHETEYKFAATEHYKFMNDRGAYLIGADKRSKRVMPIEAFAAVKAKRLELKLEVKRLNTKEAA